MLDNAPDPDDLDKSGSVGDESIEIIGIEEDAVGPSPRGVTQHTYAEGDGFRAMPAGINSICMGFAVLLAVMLVAALRLTNLSLPASSLLTVASVIAIVSGVYLVASGTARLYLDLHLGKKIRLLEQENRSIDIEILSSGVARTFGEIETVVIDPRAIALFQSDGDAPTWTRDQLANVRRMRARAEEFDCPDLVAQIDRRILALLAGFSSSHEDIAR
jgi:hypothetical protein